MTLRDAFAAVFKQAGFTTRMQVVRALDWSPTRLDHYIMGRRQMQPDAADEIAAVCKLTRVQLLRALTVNGQPYALAPERAPIDSGKRRGRRPAGAPPIPQYVTPETVDRLQRGIFELCEIDPALAERMSAYMQGALRILSIDPAAANDQQATQKTIGIVSALHDPQPLPVKRPARRVSVPQ